MTLRAGTARQCTFTGVLRVNRYPWYVCIHKHATPEEARECSRAAKKYMDDRTAQGAPLPEGWTNYDPTDMRWAR
jgi:hypothetical protein